MSAFRLTVLRRSSSKLTVWVSFDTSSYTRLKFIPRSFEKSDWCKQNALMISLQFFSTPSFDKNAPKLECYSMEFNLQSNDNTRSESMQLKHPGGIFYNAGIWGAFIHSVKILSYDYSLGCEWRCRKEPRKFENCRISKIRKFRKSD